MFGWTQVMIWKEYGKTIRRLWLNLFGAVVFGFMLAGLAANLAEKYPSKASLIYIISGVIGTVFYFYLLSQLSFFLPYYSY